MANWFTSFQDGRTHKYAHTLHDTTQCSYTSIASQHTDCTSLHITSHLTVPLLHTTSYHILQHSCAPYNILHNTTLHCIQIRYVGLSFLRKLGKQAKVQLHWTFNKIMKTSCDLFLYLCGWIACTFVNNGKHW